MSLEVNMVSGKKCVSLAVTPNDPLLSRIIVTYS